MSENKGRKDEREYSRPVRHFLMYWIILLLLGFCEDCARLVDHDLSGFIVGRVASRAQLLADAGLTSTLLDDLLERAAGIR